MSKVPSKKDISQSSIFSFFRPVNQTSSSKENNILQKTYEKRTHKEMEDNLEDSKKIEEELAPLKKTFPPKSKNEKESETIVEDMEKNIDLLLNDIQDIKKSKKLIKNKKIITDSDENDSDFQKENENIQNNDEESAKIKNKKRKNNKIDEDNDDENEKEYESCNDGINLNNFLKETLYK